MKVDDDEVGEIRARLLLTLGVVLVGVLISLVWHACQPSNEDRVHDAMWTTYSVGNVDTYKLAQVRPSTVKPDALCGRINYEQSDNRGWSGYSDFYMLDEVIYIAPAGGRYATQFADLCLAPPAPAPGRPNPEQP